MQVLQGAMSGISRHSLAMLDKASAVDIKPGRASVGVERRVENVSRKGGGSRMRRGVEMGEVGETRDENEGSKLECLR